MEICLDHIVYDDCQSILKYDESLMNRFTESFVNNDRCMSMQTIYSMCILHIGHTADNVDIRSKTIFKIAGFQGHFCFDRISRLESTDMNIVSRNINASNELSISFS